MGQTIKIDAEVARKLQAELSSLMYDYDGETTKGRTLYACRFCGGFCYGPEAFAKDLNEIVHAPDCLGEKAMHELDAGFRELE